MGGGFNFHCDRFNILIHYEIFESTFATVLDKHAPMKSKCIRGNEKPHMNKSLKKAIMRRTKLWNKYCKSKSSEDLDAYRGQRNLITKMNKKAKYDHFNRTIQAFKNDSKAFWKSCKPFFSNSGPVETQLSLNHNGHIIQNSFEIANILNVHYSDCLLYTSPSPRDATLSRMPSSA